MNTLADIVRGLTHGTRFEAQIGRTRVCAGRYWQRHAGVVYRIEFPDAPHLAHLNESHHDAWETARSMCALAVWTEAEEERVAR